MQVKTNFFVTGRASVEQKVPLVRKNCMSRYICSFIIVLIYQEKTIVNKFYVIFKQVSSYNLLRPSIMRF